MRRRVTLSPEFDVTEAARAASFQSPYLGSSTHRLECGHCGSHVASGVDPYLYPSMFRGATHIECAECSELSALPADL